MIASRTSALELVPMKPIDLAANLEPLRAWFDANAAHVRLLAIQSAT